MSCGQHYRPAIDQIEATLNLQLIGSLSGGITRETKHWAILSSTCGPFAVE